MYYSWRTPCALDSLSGSMISCKLAQCLWTLVPIADTPPVEADDRYYAALEFSSMAA